MQGRPEPALPALLMALISDWRRSRFGLTTKGHCLAQPVGQARLTLGRGASTARWRVVRRIRAGAVGSSPVRWSWLPLHLPWGGARISGPGSSRIGPVRR